MNSRGAAGAAWLALILIAAAPASGAYRVEGPRVVSGPVGPPGLACRAPSPPRTSDQSVAIDPRDPNHLVAAWMQDRPGSDVDGAQGLGVAVSRDAGKSWSAARLPGITGCDGGAAQHSAVNEAQVAIGNDGTVYVTGELHRGAARRPFVVRSTDGGTRWGAPALLDPTEGFAGQESIAPDPLRPRHAYVSWHRVEPHPLGPLFGTAVLSISESADGGEHWSPPREVRRPGSGLYDVASHVMRPRDGSLVVVFAEQTPSSFSGRPARIPIKSIRSTDGGATWARPVDVGSIVAGATLDPDDGSVVNRFPAEATAQAPDGTLYVVDDTGGTIWRVRATAGSGK